MLVDVSHETLESLQIVSFVLPRQQFRKVSKDLEG